MRSSSDGIEMFKPKRGTNGFSALARVLSLGFGVNLPQSPATLAVNSAFSAPEALTSCFPFPTFY
jgi:hypothetical protein